MAARPFPAEVAAALFVAAAGVVAAVDEPASSSSAADPLLRSSFFSCNFLRRLTEKKSTPFFLLFSCIDYNDGFT